MDPLVQVELGAIDKFPHPLEITEALADGHMPFTPLVL